MARTRLDQALVARGHFETRALAQAAIAAGLVQVDGLVASKASQMVAADAVLDASAPWPWVSRAGVKLAHALDHWAIRVAGRVCLDLGSSTGGFSHVLVAHGANHVSAVDVGTGQFHASLRGHPAITLHEQTDVRTLRAEHLGHGPPDLIVADLSFIGLAKALPVPLSLAAPQATLVTLVKPQFEAGPERMGKGGLVPPNLAEGIARKAAGMVDGLSGFRLNGMIESPITGGDGNREWLARFERG
jgi:23S rRNA (cytidine1920-2'-O)/16S rRNA (cytidine1409-2'-O)-methyltransferase